MKKLILFVFLAGLALAQAPITNIQRSGANLTADFTVGTGRTLTIGTGGTLTGAGTFNLGSANSVTLPATVSGLLYVTPTVLNGYFGDPSTQPGWNATNWRTDLSINNVDNTSDLNKPISTATQTALDTKQPTSTALTNLLAVSSNGALTRTAANTYAARTITGTNGEITVDNGDGVSGNPTISLPSTITQATTFSAPLAISPVSSASNLAINRTTSAYESVVRYQTGGSNVWGVGPRAGETNFTVRDEANGISALTFVPVTGAATFSNDVRAANYGSGAAAVSGVNYYAFGAAGSNKEIFRAGVGVEAPFSLILDTSTRLLRFVDAGGPTTRMTLDLSSGALTSGGAIATSSTVTATSASNASFFSIRTGGATLRTEGGATTGQIKTTTNHALVLGANNTDFLTLGTTGDVTGTIPGLTGTRTFFLSRDASNGAKFAYDNANNRTVITNMWDDGAGEAFRLVTRGAGTPVTALSVTGAGAATFIGSLSFDGGAIFSDNGGNLRATRLGLGTAPNGSYSLDTAGAIRSGGDITVSKANPDVAVRSASDAAGQIQYLTFGSPTYNRAQLRSTSAGTSNGSLSLYAFNAGSPILSQTWGKDGEATFASAVNISGNVSTQDSIGLMTATLSRATGSLWGWNVAPTFSLGGSLNNGASLRVVGPSLTLNGNTLTNAYGIRVENVSGATNNFAISTGTGRVSFGDTTDATSKDAAGVILEGGLAVEKGIISPTVEFNLSGAQRIKPSDGFTYFQYGSQPGVSIIAGATGGATFQAEGSNKSLTFAPSGTGTIALQSSVTIGATGTAITKIRMVDATLVGGTVTVSDAAIAAGTSITVASKTPGGTPGALFISSKTASTGYTITSTSATDTSVVTAIIYND